MKAKHTMKKENHSAPRQPSLPQLHSIVLNNCQVDEPPFKSFLHQHDQFTHIAATPGVSFKIGTNLFKVQIVYFDGSAVLFVIGNSNPSALAFMAWTKSVQEDPWEELLIALNEKPTNFRLPLPNLLNLRPPALPWIGISMLHNYRSNDLDRETDDTLRVTWAAAYGILQHIHDRASQTEPGIQPNPQRNPDSNNPAETPPHPTAENQPTNPSGPDQSDCSQP
ncbi:MAG: hypothetical protein ABSF38_01315 [Verrucomicrobiota bacterium]|jgi:hypothetical protein